VDPVSQRVVGRYLIHDPIAAGGMATVHLGRLVGPVGFTRTVAIKRLHPQFASDPEFVAMFIDEARLAARIHHPNVVQTLDVVASGQELFLVMDYVQGEPLSRLRRLGAERAQSIPLRVVTSIFCGALHGLHAAHEAKSDHGKSLDIVHRDVSPQNVLVGTDGIARVLDFGVAKALGQAHTTRDGHLKGKLAYMAPEQLQGKVTRKTDVFAASIVLWEALTEERLFSGQDDGEVVGKIFDRPIEPPSKLLKSASDAASIGQAGLDRLDAVVVRGLARDPEQRFDTAREMALALEACFGVASPTEVGLWVEETASVVLDERARRVAEIESQTSARAPQSVPQPSLRDGEPPTVRAPPHVEMASQASSVSLSRSKPPPRPPHAWALTGLVALVVALGTSVAFLSLWNRGVASRSSMRTTTPVATEVVVTRSVSPPPSASSPNPPRPVDTLPSSAPSAPSGSAAAGPRRSGKTPVPAAAAQPDCTTPYTIDSAGHQHFREECFH
jgi:serine/threonine protein kinase